MNDDLGELYKFACFFTGIETDKAVLVFDLASGEELWIPFSQVSEMHKGKTSEGTIIMSAWIAKKKGLI